METDRPQPARRAERRRRRAEREHQAPPIEHNEVTLCEALDRVLHAGVVVAGEVVISVAGIELVYVGLNAMVASVETARRAITAEPGGGGA